MRGATPIVAVVLLLLITVAAAGTTYFWITRIQSNLFEQTTSGIEEKSKDIYGSLSIVSVWNVSTKICMLIRNTSKQNIRYTKSDLQKLAVLIDGIPYGFNKSAINVEALDPGDAFVLCLCNVTSTSDCTGNEYQYLPEDNAYPTIHITIDPPFGTGDTYDFKYEED